MVLGIAATLFLCAFLLIPRYSSWLDKRMLKLYANWSVQTADLSEDGRMKDAYIGFYHLYGQIEQYFSKPELQSYSILTPSREYLKNRGVSAGYLEESIIYYMTGVRAEQVKEERTEYEASYALVFTENNEFVIKPINSRAEFERYLKELMK